ncbi:uncharacterized protein KY384_008045 [Bacidia gigantensis]|uniref:uncharacterized protein n=1 Tax=Bacidia gigantensis TaxID=2732470 RepID=UPI001D057AEB|nr:uncharacterized protein KY384_008045 [Bacidia gigantensis]KAG8527301.1 hypothetical protein KY384_008045 [Bacidia gigantensis]
MDYAHVLFLLLVCLSPWLAQVIEEATYIFALLLKIWFVLGWLSLFANWFLIQSCTCTWFFCGGFHNLFTGLGICFIPGIHVTPLPAVSPWESLPRNNNTDVKVDQFIFDLLVAPEKLRELTTNLKHERRRLLHAPFDGVPEVRSELAILIDASTNLSSPLAEFSHHVCWTMDSISWDYQRFLTYMTQYANAGGQPYRNITFVNFFLLAPFETLRMLNSQLNSSLLPHYTPYAYHIQSQILHDFEPLYRSASQDLKKLERFTKKEYPAFARALSPILEGTSIGTSAKKNAIASLEDLIWKEVGYKRYIPGLMPPALADRIEDIRYIQRTYTTIDMRLTRFDDTMTAWTDYIERLQQELDDFHHLVDQSWGKRFMDLMAALHIPFATRSARPHVQQSEADEGGQGFLEKPCTWQSHGKNNTHVAVSGLEEWSCRVGRFASMLLDAQGQGDKGNLGFNGATWMDTKRKARAAFERELGTEETVVLKAADDVKRTLESGGTVKVLEGWK